MDQMKNERTQQLLLFQTSERYLSRVAAALQHKAGQESKFRRCAHAVVFPSRASAADVHSYASAPIAAQDAASSPACVS